MPLPYLHLSPDDYPTAFPSALDAVPLVVQKSTFYDGWIFNRVFGMLQTVQLFLINNKARIEVLPPPG